MRLPTFFQTILAVSSDRVRRPDVFQAVQGFRLLVVLPALALIAYGCRTPAAAPKAAPAAVKQENSAAAPFQIPVAEGDRLLSPQEAAQYLGDQACAACHASLCRGYAGTRHSSTLKRVTVQEQGDFFRRKAAIKDASLGYTYRPAIESDKCVIIGEKGAQRGVLPADYVIGTGRNALTYLSAERPDAWVDLRISYYTGTKQWDYTPTQRPGNRPFARAAGIVQDGPKLPACLKCHITYLREGAGGMDIAKSHIGIGCERCHGPGQSHVAAVKSGQWNRSASGDLSKALFMENFRKASPARINEVCGVCHHNEANSQPGAFATENGLARFQGVALARSRCFQASQTLSCITCHSPHEDTARDTARNDAICLRCHASSKPLPHSTSNAIGKACPVNPRTGCTDCHMPKQTIATIPYAQYRNHWIKVWSRDAHKDNLSSGTINR